MSKNNYPIFPGHTPIQDTYNFTLEQVTKLCEMQDTLNSYIHPEWKSQGFNWMLAIQDEIMEIHGHLGWKWWKGNYNVGLTQENLRQVQLEVIDILHFELSAWSETNTAVPIHAYINSKFGWAKSIKDILHYLDIERISNGSDTLACWADLARFVGLTEQMVMETYTQKYVLNKFRQDHGYKTGEYEKEWKHEFDGLVLTREDNEVLACMVDYMKSQNDPDVADETVLYEGLQEWYNSRLNQ